MKLIGCTGSCSKSGGVLDPVESQPFLVGGKRFLLGRLQFGHSRSGIRALADADRGTLRAQDDGLSGILNEDVSRDQLLGDQLECAMLKVFVGDVAVVQKCDVRVGGPDLLHQRERHRREPQHAESAGASPASRIADRGGSVRAGRTPEGAGTGRNLKIADKTGKQGRNGLTFIPRLGVGLDGHGSNPAPGANCRGRVLPSP